MKVRFTNRQSVGLARHFDYTDQPTRRPVITPSKPLVKSPLVYYASGLSPKEQYLQDQRELKNAFSL